MNVKQAVIYYINWKIPNRIAILFAVLWLAIHIYSRRYTDVCGSIYLYVQCSVYSIVLAAIVYLGMAQKKQDIYTFEFRICGRSLIFCTTPSLSHHTHNKPYSHIAQCGPGMLCTFRSVYVSRQKLFLFFLLFRFLAPSSVFCRRRRRWNCYFDFLFVCITLLSISSAC